jgi:hypothetical protein
MADDRFNLSKLAAFEKWMPTKKGKGKGAQRAATHDDDINDIDAPIVDDDDNDGAITVGDADDNEDNDDENDMPAPSTAHTRVPPKVVAASTASNKKKTGAPPAIPTKKGATPKQRNETKKPATIAVRPTHVNDNDNDNDGDDNDDDNNDNDDDNDDALEAAVNDENDETGDNDNDDVAPENNDNDDDDNDNDSKASSSSARGGTIRSGNGVSSMGASVIAAVTSAATNPKKVNKVAGMTPAKLDAFKEKMKQRGLIYISRVLLTMLLSYLVTQLTCQLLVYRSHRICVLQKCVHYYQYKVKYCVSILPPRMHQ